MRRESVEAAFLRVLGDDAGRGDAPRLVDAPYRTAAGAAPSEPAAPRDGGAP